MPRACECNDLIDFMSLLYEMLLDSPIFAWYTLLVRHFGLCEACLMIYGNYFSHLAPLVDCEYKEEHTWQPPF